MKEKILVVDDDPNLLRVISYQLSEAGYNVSTAVNADKALALLDDEQIDLLLTDIKMPGMDGMELLKNALSINPDLPVILITAFADIESAVESIKEGAVDYIPKPFSRDNLLKKLERALEAGRLREENVLLKKALARKGGLEGTVGDSDAIRRVYEMVAQAAPSESTVFIYGESGTGKELLAQAIHRLSPRSSGPMVAINCAAIPDNLLESELFGHVRGAFTGAIKDRVGVFQQANGGTLFLDEVADIQLDLQPKLLRVLQERKVVRVGGSKLEKVDVRIVTATKENLKEMVQQGIFREDLYWRLHVIPIEVPSLRERKSDIPLLTDYFLNKYFPDRDLKFTAKAMKVLEEHSWPGNIRELENLVQRLGVMIRSKNIDVKHLPEDLFQRAESDSSIKLPDIIGVEKEAYLKALEFAGWNKSAAARKLGIPRHVLVYRMKKYGVEPKS